MLLSSVAIWGDSILKGTVFDDESGKYRQCSSCGLDVIKRKFPELALENHAAFGCTAPKAEARLVKALSDGKHPDAALIEFGGNDCDFDWAAVSARCRSEHKPHTEYQTFVDTLRHMVQLLIEHDIMPVLMTLPPISAELYFDFFCRSDDLDPENVLFWLRDKQVIYRTQENYSHAADIVAKEYGTALIDVRTQFLFERRTADFLCTDGIHLNEKGQIMMGEILAEGLASL